MHEYISMAIMGILLFWVLIGTGLSLLVLAFIFVWWVICRDDIDLP